MFSNKLLNSLANIVLANKKHNNTMLREQKIIDLFIEDLPNPIVFQPIKILLTDKKTRVNPRLVRKLTELLPNIEDEESIDILLNVIWRIVSHSMFRNGTYSCWNATIIHSCRNLIHHPLVHNKIIPGLIRLVVDHITLYDTMIELKVYNFHETVNICIDLIDRHNTLIMKRTISDVILDNLLTKYLEEDDHVWTQSFSNMSILLIKLKQFIPETIYCALLKNIKDEKKEATCIDILLYLIQHNKNMASELAEHPNFKNIEDIVNNENKISKVIVLSLQIMIHGIDLSNEATKQLSNFLKKYPNYFMIQYEEDSISQLELVQNLAKRLNISNNLTQKVDMLIHRTNVKTKLMEYGINPSFPDEFICPISLEIMFDPVVASDGHTYERESIMKIFKTSQKSPLTRERLSTTVYQNHNLKQRIRCYFDEILIVAEHVASSAK